MSILELVLIAAGGAASAAIRWAIKAVIPSLRELRGASASPLPVTTLIAAAASLLAVPLCAWWGSSRWVGWVAQSAPDGLVQVSPSDRWLAVVYAAALIAIWAATPGVAALAWLVVSPGRRWGRAVVFALVTWLGATLGLAGGAQLALASLDSMIAAMHATVGVSIAFLDLVGMTVRAGLGGGFAGACAAAVCGVAASSRNGSRAAWRATAMLPFVATLTGALATPPDVRSQLSFAVAFTMLWMTGLGLGSGFRAWLVRREATA